ncbi:hypothetical protein BGZ60DRAFT_534697 [Tricladium varicosporioides]|nr:hypothetical protein BGZ60DRAFT_534697 [Hymenoscyphus varicosporioides]
MTPKPFPKVPVQQFPNHRFPDPLTLQLFFVSMISFCSTIIAAYQAWMTTAGGYRACQPHIMGLWAKKTALIPRLTQARIEVVFCSPDISYQPIYGPQKQESVEKQTGKYALINTKRSLENSMTFRDCAQNECETPQASKDLVCWVSLLHELHKQGEEVMRVLPPKSFADRDTPYSSYVPAVEVSTKSYDAIPPQVGIPLATTTISALAIMARRFGIKWKIFEPYEGKFRGEGNGHIITSSSARLIGAIVEYYNIKQESSASRCFYIPTRKADKLGFGLVECDRKVFGNKMPVDLDVGSSDGLAKTMPLLMGRGAYRNKKGLVRIMKKLSRSMELSEIGFIPGLNDLVPLCAPMMITSSVLDLWMNSIPAPNQFKKGVTHSREALQVFESRLQDHLNDQGRAPSQQGTLVLRALKFLRENHSANWDTDEETDLWDDREGDDVSFRQDVRARIEANALIRQYHMDMTDYLSHSEVDYRDLVGEHMVTATASVMYTIPGSTPRSDILTEFGLDEFSDPALAHSMSYYWDNLPELVDRIIRRQELWDHRYGISRQTVEDAWFSMMFRAFCFQRTHHMIPDNPPVASVHWESRLPVHIG